MQTIVTYIANYLALASLISLRALISDQAMKVYGGLLLLVGCVIGHAALILLGIACLYFQLRERDTEPTEPTHPDEKAEQS